MKALDNTYGGRPLRVTVGIIALAILLLAGGAGAATLTVDDSGGANYTRILDAINNASQGDTIIVKDGTYIENVNVNKRLTIISENGFASTTIDGGKNGDIVHITTDFANLSGFTISNSSENENGIFLNGANYVNISNNIITKNFKGILLERSENNTLSNNIINSNNADGINLLDSSNNNLISYNTIDSNGVSVLWGGGIRLGDGGNPARNVTGNIVIGNIVSNNTDDGIGLEWSERNVVTDNVIISNHAEGISLYHSNYSIISNNTANNNNRNGFGLLDSHNNTFTNNTAGNSETGIKLEQSYNNIIKDNIVNSNSNQGIAIFESLQNIVSDNLVQFNGREGIYLQLSNLTLIKNQTVNLTTGNGILLQNSNNNQILNNNVSNSRNYPEGYLSSGIRLESSENNQISDNAIYRSTASGISLKDSNNNKVTNNTASSNNADGISLDNYNNNNTISYNIISNNSNHAIYLELSNSNTISDNIAFNSFKYNGIGLNLSDSNTIKNNTIYNNTHNGIWLGSSNNNLILNNSAYDNNNNGILLNNDPNNGSNHNTIANNTVNNNKRDGINLRNSSNNVIMNNIANNNSDIGIYIRIFSNNNIITDNIVSSNNWDGITLDFSSNNTLRRNNISNNRHNFGVFGDALTDFEHNIDTSNTVNNMPIYYLINIHNQVIDYDFGYLALINSTNISIKDVTIKNNSQGILLAYTQNSIIQNITALNNFNGIHVIFSSNNTLKDNIVRFNDNSGFRVFQSFNNTLLNNSANLNQHEGIALRFSSSNNRLIDNIAFNNEVGVLIFNSSYNILAKNIAYSNKIIGIAIDGSSLYDYNHSIDTSNIVNGKSIYYWYNISDQIINGLDTTHLTIAGSNNVTIENNNISNGDGIHLAYVENSLISKNVIYNNTGIWIDTSNNNTITSNNIINNTFDVRSVDSNNIWNSPQPITYTYNGSEYVNKLGNYWSDYNGSDLNGDGIGDVAYSIDGDADYYPLIKPFETYFQVPSTTELIMNETKSSNSTLFETIISQNATLNTSVRGDFNGTLNFTNLEFVLINSGAFNGKGFSKGSWAASIEGNSYYGNWQGMLFKKPEERRIYLKGTVSGGLKGIVEGYLAESANGSNVYDSYQTEWTISHIGNDIVFAKLDFNDTVNYLDSVGYSSELYALQTSIEGKASGYYNGSLSTVLTHVRINNETNPYYGQGFSIISYISGFGSGEGWTYDTLISKDMVELKGLFTSPLMGIVSGTLDETGSPKKLSLAIERIDIGLPPAVDLKVKVWGPGMVSPGQTVDYIIEYRNDGLKKANEVIIFSSLDPLINYTRASGEAFYDEFAHAVSWNLSGVKAKSNGYLSIQAYVPWGLPLGTTLSYSASIANIELNNYIDNDLSGNEIYHSNEYLGMGNNEITNEQTTCAEGKGIFGNGIGAWNKYFDIIGILGNRHEREKSAAYAKERGLDWIKAFQGPPLRDISDVKNAYEGIATDTNHLNDPRWGTKESPCVYDEVHVFSGSTTVAIRNILDGKTKVRKLLRLISPFWEHEGGAWKVADDLYEKLKAEYPGVRIEIWQSEKDKFKTIFRDYTEMQVKVPRGEENNRGWLNVIRRDELGHLGLLKAANDDEKVKGDASSSGATNIVTARDPNIKYGPEGFVSPNQKLNYTVEYENEGEGIAFGVYFTDTLDEDLNASTLEIGPVISTINGSVIAPHGTYNPSTRTVTWLVGEVGSGEGGYANISVNARSNAGEGTEIINYATVYFPSVPETTRTNGIVSVVTTPTPSLVSAITPTSRVAQIGVPITLFMSIINSGTATATGVSITQNSSLPATVSYQQWNGTAFIGSPNTPVDIPAGSAAHFVLTINATAQFATSTMTFSVSSTNAPIAPISRVNTLTLSTSAVPYADVIMMSTSLAVSTAVNTPTTFAVATSNVGGASATGVSLTLDIPSTITGLAYQVNETYPANGTIKGPATGLAIPVGAQPTFAVFLTPTQPITYDPANNRITLQLIDGSGKIIGAQSVAVSTT